jgi:secernin
MCDTFVAMPDATGEAAVLFGKNSDREPNEAQVLEYHPPQEHAAGSQVQCTYLAIPQVRHTHGVLLSRPFWMWGAEMGVNERGVVIGNEAVFTRMPVDRGRRLLGMDILRLALERSTDASAALQVITSLLAEYGQGGLAGYEDRHLAYHNSYIIADPRQAWVLETAGPLWAALRVKGTYSISNGLTIGEQYDECHPELVETARKRGWLRRGSAFDFARCYSDWFYHTFSACRARRRRSLLLLRRGGLSVVDAFRILRDHGEGEGYRPDRHLLMDRICAHAANPVSRNGAQSVGSLVVRLRPGETLCWATGTSAPCTGIFKPIWMEGPVLPDLGPAPGPVFDSRSLWWRHEGLHRRILRDFALRLGRMAQPRDELEGALVERAHAAAPRERFALTQSAFVGAEEAEARWSEEIGSLPVRQRPGPVYRRYWALQNRKRGLTL